MPYVTLSNVDTKLMHRLYCYQGANLQLSWYYFSRIKYHGIPNTIHCAVSINNDTVQRVGIQLCLHTILHNYDFFSGVTLGTQIVINHHCDPAKIKSQNKIKHKIKKLN